MNFIIYGALIAAAALCVLYILVTWMRMAEASEQYQKWPMLYRRPTLNFGLFVFELIVRAIIGCFFGGIIGAAILAVSLVAL